MVDGWYQKNCCLCDKFHANTTDTRGQFYKDGQTKEIKKHRNFTDGYAIQKFRNVDGVQGLR
jgi:hypothetical protein